MDNLSKLVFFIILFFSVDAQAINQWVPTWIDGNVSATYERTPTYLRTYVNYPAYGGAVANTLYTNPVNSWGLKANGKQSYVSPASTATTPKIASNVKIPMGSAAGAAAIATLTAVIPKTALAKAAVALVRANPYVSTAITVGWLANAGLNYFSSTDTFTKNLDSAPLSACPAARVPNGTVFYYKNSGTSPFGWTYTATAGSTSAACPGNYGNGLVCIDSVANSWQTFCVTDVSSAPGSLPVTQQQAETVLANAPVSGSSDTAINFDGVLKEAIANGINPDLDTSTTPQLTGSSTPVQGSKSTTTTPTGDVITTNTTYNNTYNNNYVDATETTTTITTPVSGTPTTQTTTGPANTSLVTAPQQQKTDCDNNPTHVGCLELGTVAIAEVIPVTNVGITITPSSWGSGSCPADVHTHFLSRSLTISYSPFCTYLSAIAPVIIALAWFSAGLIVFGAIKD